jgi:hypothetical protein
MRGWRAERLPGDATGLCLAPIFATTDLVWPPFLTKEHVSPALPSDRAFSGRGLPRAITQRYHHLAVRERRGGECRGE